MYALTARLPCLEKKDVWEVESQWILPVLGVDEVLVKNSYVALNPYDWKAIKYRFALKEEKTVMGRDGSGIVWRTGSEVERLKRGDRVWFCSNGARPHAAAFQEFSIHHANEIGKLPDDIPEVQAATFGTGLLTASVVLFKSLGLPMKPWRSVDSQQPWLLVWAGMASTGIYVIQIARELGWRVICTASSVNEEYLLGLGATVVVDRSLPLVDQIDEIKARTAGDLVHAIDNLGSETANHCFDLLQHANSLKSVPPLRRKLVAIAGNPTADENPDSNVEQIRLSFSTTFYGKHDWSGVLLNYLMCLMQLGKLKPGRHVVLPHGLHGIERALGMMEKGEMKSGLKPIIRLSDTRRFEEALPTPIERKRKPSPEVVIVCEERYRLRSRRKMSMDA